MADNPEIHYVSYEEVVKYLRRYRREYLGTLLNQFDHLFESRGELSVYWPADTYVIDFDVSSERATLIRRLLSDPRIRVNPQIDGATLAVSAPRRGWSKEPANPQRAAKLEPYAQDRKLTIQLESTESDTLEDHELHIEAGNVRWVWIG